jgi:hypothetical protein
VLIRKVDLHPLYLVVREIVICALKSLQWRPNDGLKRVAFDQGIRARLPHEHKLRNGTDALLECKEARRLDLRQVIWVADGKSRGTFAVQLLSEVLLVVRRLNIVRV